MSKRSSAGSLTVFGLGLTLAVSLINGPAEGGQGASQAPAERGRYLVGITGCHDCHSPKASGMSPESHARVVRTSVHDRSTGADESRGARVARFHSVRRAVRPDRRVQPHARRGHRDRNSVQRGVVHHRHAHGQEAQRHADPAAHAQRGVPEHDRRRPQGDLGLPAHDQARSKRGLGRRAAAGACWRATLATAPCTQNG